MLAPASGGMFGIRSAPDPVIGLGIAAAAAWEGIQSWRGDDCC
jgi:hypothetical protein